MKTISIAGRVGRDAATRNAGDTTVTGFSVAVDGREGREKTTTWFDVSIWGKRGTALESYIRKGGSVSVAGELTTREHEGKTYLGVRADQITLLGGRSEPSAPSGGGHDTGIDDTDIPF